MKLLHFQTDDRLIPDPTLLMPAGRVPPQIETWLRLARYILRRTGPP
jgi:hypothetical protein